MRECAPKVSVLMPAYNSEKYVGAAIESILNQTFADFEFIIINDGSTDGTPEIINKYARADKRIRFIDNKKNQGIIAVLNNGLDLCRGEYIARMDSDDISLPERLKKQVKYMNAHPECGACGTWIRKFGTKTKGKVIKYPDNAKLLDFVIHGNLVANPSSMVRRTVIVANKIKYNPQYKYAEDYGFWIDVVKHNEIHNLQDVLLNYRWYDNNVSVTHKHAQIQCTERIRRDVLNSLFSLKDDITKMLNLTWEINERFCLFGFLPIIRRKQYSIVKTKYYLFEKIPLIKEKDGKIYLFEFIKIGTLR